MSKNALKNILTIAILILWVAASYVICQYVVGLVFKFILGDKLGQTFWLMIYELVSYLCSIGVIISFPQLICKKYKTTKTELGLEEPLSWTGLLLAPAGFIIYAVLASIANWLFSFFNWYDADQVQNIAFGEPSTGIERLLIFIILAIIAPIAEEIIFRGWLYGKIRKKLPNKAISIVVSSLLVSILFGFLHFQWNVGINVFCLSLVLCILRELTGNIHSGILLHMLKNGLAFYLLWII